jgi:hypothetical protein
MSERLPDHAREAVPHRVQRDISCRCPFNDIDPDGKNPAFDHVGDATR